MRKLVLVIALFFSSIWLFAKKNEERPPFVPELSIGTNHGLSASFMFFAPGIKENLLLGYNGGISFRYLGERYAGFLLECNYAQNGWKEKNGYTYRSGYVEIPMMTHLFFGNKNRFFINLGPKISFKVHGKVTNTGSNLDDDSILLHQNNFNRIFDIGVCGGIGYEFNASKTAYQIDIRYNCGLRDIFETTYNSDYYRALNQSICAKFVVFFKL